MRRKPNLKAKEYKLNLSKVMEKVLSDIITSPEGQ